MNKEQKAAVVDEVAAEITASEAVFAVDYRGISVPQAAELRGKLSEADATLRVVKNTLTERAADKADAGSLKELLEGPTALTFVKGDVALAAKAISQFRKEHEVPTFKGGTMNGDALTVDQIESIAKLPSREVLNGQFVGVLASPLTGLVRGLGSLIGGLAIQLGAIRDQGLVTGEAPAPAAAEPEPEAAAPAEEAPAAEAEEAPAEEAPAAEAEEAPAAEAEAPAEEPSEAPGDPVAEAEKAEEDATEETPSEGETQEEEG